MSTEESSPENTAEYTEPEWPDSVCVHSPVEAFQILAVASSDAVSVEEPSQENTAEHT